MSENQSNETIEVTEKMIDAGEMRLRIAGYPDNEGWYRERRNMIKDIYIEMELVRSTGRPSPYLAEHL